MILFQTLEHEEQKLSADRSGRRADGDSTSAPSRGKMGFLEGFELMLALYSEQVLRGLR